MHTKARRHTIYVVSVDRCALSWRSESLLTEIGEGIPHTTRLLVGGEKKERTFRRPDARYTKVL